MRERILGYDLSVALTSSTLYFRISLLRDFKNAGMQVVAVNQFGDGIDQWSTDQGECMVTASGLFTDVHKICKSTLQIEYLCTERSSQELLHAYLA